MINKKMLKNNSTLSVNISAFQGFMNGTRALVLSAVPGNIDQLPRLNDYYDLIILNAYQALSDVEADFVVYSSNTPYVNNVLHLTTLESYTDTVFVTNYNAIDVLSRAYKKSLLFNVNYLPSQGTMSASPILERGVACGLSVQNPGVHLAAIIGCTEIYCDQPATGAVLVTDQDIQDFVTSMDMYKPTNLISTDRPLIMSSKL